jgi:hypothetical protein
MHTASMAFLAEDKAALRNEPQPELLYDPAIAAAALEFALEGLEAVAQGKTRRGAGPKARLLRTTRLQKLHMIAPTLCCVLFRRPPPPLGRTALRRACPLYMPLRFPPICCRACPVLGCSLIAAKAPRARTSSRSPGMIAVHTGTNFCIHCSVDSVKCISILKFCEAESIFMNSATS